MYLYDLLCKWPFLKGYAGKFLFVAFIGTHTPMIGLIFYLIIAGNIQDQWAIVLVVFFFTGFTTAATLLAIHRLLGPVRMAAHGLNSYLASGVKPQLPRQYEDEAGLLLKDIDRTITELDHIITSHHGTLTRMAQFLNIPSRSILLMTEELLQQNYPQPHSSYLKNIQQISLRQMNFAEEMLQNLQKGEMSISTPVRQVSRLDNLLEPVLQFFANDHRFHNIQVEKAYPRDELIFVDLILIQQVMETILGQIQIRSILPEKVIINGGKTDDHFWLILDILLPKADQDRLSSTTFTPITPPIKLIQEVIEKADGFIDADLIPEGYQYRLQMPHVKIVGKPTTAGED